MDCVRSASLSKAIKATARPLKYYRLLAVAFFAFGRLEIENYIYVFSFFIKLQYSLGKFNPLNKCISIFSRFITKNAFLNNDKV